MATLIDYTVQVLNLPPATTLADLYIFFSYCGTVEKIQLYRNDAQSSMALLRFRQPYAFRASLLLDGAVFADQRIGIVISKSVPIYPVSDQWTHESEGMDKLGFLPSVHVAARAAASRSR